MDGVLTTLTAKEHSQPLQTSNHRWVVLFASFLAFVVFAYVFQVVPPLLGIIQTDFHVGDAEAGLLMSMVVIPGIFLALPAGLMVNRYGFRSLGFLSIILVAVGSLATALATTFPSALLGRLILGVGGAFIVVGTPTFIPQWFTRKDLGKAMGIYAANMPVATILAFSTANLLERSFDWHFPFYVGTVASLVCALVFVFVAKEGPLKGEHTPVRMEEVKHALRAAEVWKASLVWVFFNTTAIAFLSWSPKWFSVFKGIESFYASLLANGLMIAAVFFAPIFGWISGKVGRRKPIMILGSVSTGLTLIAIAYAYDLPLVMSVAVLGISAATVPPLVMAIIAESLPPRLSGTGFSIITLCQNIGMTLSAPLAGYIMQTTSSLPLTFFGISLFTYASALTTLTIKSR